MSKIHPSSGHRAKLSVHMKAEVSVAPGAPTKFTVAASEALLKLLVAKGVTVEEKQYRALSAAEPPVAAVKEFWTGHLKGLPSVSPDSAKEIVASIDKFAVEHSPPTLVNADEGKLSDDAVYIKDTAAFKANLPISKAATPIQIYSDFDSHL